LDRQGASAIDRAFREERAAVLAALIRQIGDFTLAEDAVQDAFADAVVAWPRDGIPRNPGAWLTVGARRRAIDRLRRDRSIADRAARLAELVHLSDEAEAEPDTEGPIVDDRLRLIFTCCHPALDRRAQVALTLRTLGGLTTAEIARAFLVSEPTMGKRIVRAKRKIAEAGIPYHVPDDVALPGRLPGVLRVVYLIFNEGYSASAGDRLVRGELCAEAIRLGRLLSRLMPDDGEVWGLLSLLLLHHARRDARVDEHGRFVRLEEQIRDAWDQEMLAEGLRALTVGLRLGVPGEYQLQAVITALHVRPRSPSDTDWNQIADLYGRLAAINPSPVVELNRAAAVGLASGAEAGLELLAALLGHASMAGYQPMHVTHAELLVRAGRPEDAAQAYRQALALTRNEVEHTDLQARLNALNRGDHARLHAAPLRR
jgi:RNA polymerase sigma-70 factor, ECF subfamily